MARPPRTKQPPARLEDVSAPPRIRAVRQTRTVTKAVAPSKVHHVDLPSDHLSSSSNEDDDYDADADMEKKRGGRSRYVKVYRHHHYSLRYHEGEGFYHLVGPHGIPKYLVKLPDHKPTILPSLDIGLIREVLDRAERFSSNDMLHWLKSNDVLPIIKRWTQEIDCKSAVRGLMLFAFREETAPWRSHREYALSWSHEPKDDGKNPHIGLLAKYANLLVDNNRLWFEENFGKYELGAEDKLRIAISVLLVAWSDLQLHSSTGFFGLLLDSPLATPKYVYSRRVLDMWFIIDEAAIEKEQKVNAKQIATQQARRVEFQRQRQSAETPRPLALKAKHKKLAVSIGETRAAQVFKRLAYAPHDEYKDGLRVFKMVSDLKDEVKKKQLLLDEVSSELRKAEAELELLQEAHG